MLDITQTISTDVQELLCPSLICLTKDFIVSEEDLKAGLSRRAAAKKLLETSLKPLQGISSEAIRKNKVIECIKTICTQLESFTTPKPEEADYQTEQIRVCTQIKKLVQHKKVCGKPLNAKMLLSLALEYTETLSSMGGIGKLPSNPMPLASLA